MDNELILFDRLEVIKTTINKYGEENFYLSFSGGKDSTVVHHLLDMAIPGNKIPRVYADTGIEYNLIRKFAYENVEYDDRFVAIKPSVPVKQVLETEGYPFKSKNHAHFVDIYQRRGMKEGIEHYLDENNEGIVGFTCPSILKYQFKDQNALNFRVSDKCCIRMKEEPLEKWAKENNKSIGITGLMREEGGRRVKIDCLAFRRGKVRFFQPLAKVTKEWEEWFINTNNIRLCELYYPPYNFERTGCKGCPFARDLQKVLDTMQKFFPAEYRQCEYLWQPVYDEYRRIGYRLKAEEQTKLF